MAPGITMWICANCRIAHDFSLVTSYGPCEKCGTNAICMDIQTDNKKPKKAIKKPSKPNKNLPTVNIPSIFLGKKALKKLKKR